MATVVSTPGPSRHAGWWDEGYLVIRRPDVGVGPRAADLARDVLGPDAAVVASRVDVDAPGTFGRPWARADGAAGRAVVIWHALTPATREGGCPWLVPGSHLGPVGDHDRDGAVPVTLEPGDLLVYDANLRHATSANHSRHALVAVVVEYAAGD
jgi:ectoine hydroxylase-related dioxygenase (phytanoyl-CoA dioxygenase family)